MWWIVALRVPPAEDSDSCVETIELTEVIQFLTDHVNLDNKQLIVRCLRSFMLSSVNLDESGISMLQIVTSLTPWHCGPSQFDPVEYRFDVEVQTNLHLGGLRSLTRETFDSFDSFDCWPPLWPSSPNPGQRFDVCDHGPGKKNKKGADFEVKNVESWKNN